MTGESEVGTYSSVLLEAIAVEKDSRFTLKDLLEKQAPNSMSFGKLVHRIQVHGGGSLFEMQLALASSVDAVLLEHSLPSPGKMRVCYEPEHFHVRSVRLDGEKGSVAVVLHGMRTFFDEVKISDVMRQLPEMKVSEIEEQAGLDGLLTAIGEAGLRPGGLETRFMVSVGGGSEYRFESYGDAERTFQFESSKYMADGFTKVTISEGQDTVPRATLSKALIEAMVGIPEMFGWTSFDVAVMDEALAGLFPGVIGSKESLSGLLYMLSTNMLDKPQDKSVSSYVCGFDSLVSNGLVTEENGKLSWTAGMKYVLDTFGTKLLDVYNR